MSCPTCGHTMHRLGCQLTECGGSYWCPRCDTISTEGYVSAPSLVERCRTFEKTMDAGDCSRWQSIGINESINVPEARKT